MGWEHVSSTSSRFWKREQTPRVLVRETWQCKVLIAASWVRGGERRTAASYFPALSVSSILWLPLETGSWEKQTFELTQADSISTQGSKELPDAKPGFSLNCLN